MDYYCEMCNLFIKPKSKSRHFKSINQKNLNNHKHIKLTFNTPNKDNIDKIFYTYINEYDDKYEYYLVRCESILSFHNMEGYPVASKKIRDNKKMIS